MTRKIRQIRIEGNIAYVPLTKGYEAIIDADDIHLVDRWNWCAAVTPYTVYAYRCVKSGSSQRTILMHRVLMGEPEGLDVDHRDGNGLNNNRTTNGGNLRIATASQNGCNRHIRKDNTSGFKGVVRSRGGWRASIVLNGKRQHLGYFATPNAAHDAYVAASLQLHGEFGRIS